ncbi:ataxin-10 [Selaginella moellendorffii]|uniref:ataxin-10 n=1 Tax=Selaginella moellendorffii TaxID=88036 RepID=UPI000D1C8189|nr:ataxin-10 [Selaginella moellendorffii]|eukprot:XP_024532364.1 ataxin-10 [Selaginella moellendorffii]
MPMEELEALPTLGALLALMIISGLVIGDVEGIQGHTPPRSFPKRSQEFAMGEKARRDSNILWFTVRDSKSLTSSKPSAGTAEEHKVIIAFHVTVVLSADHQRKFKLSKIPIPDKCHQEIPFLSLCFFRVLMEEAVAALREKDGEVSAALRAVVDGARSDHGRSCLAKLGAVPALVSRSRVRIDDNLLLPLLRALRNLCAGEVMNQDSFLAEQGMDLAVALASRFQKRLCSLREEDLEEEDGKFWLDCAKALFQMLGNVAGRGEQAQDSIWKAFFPEILLDLACVSTKEVLEPLSMVVYTCSRASPERRLQLARGKGSRLLAILLRDSPSSEWLSLLVEAVCLKDEHLPLVFASLGPSSTSAFSSEQAILLGVLYSVLDENQGAVAAMPWKSMEFLADTIEQSAMLVAATFMDKALPWPTGFPIADVLGFSLLLTRLATTHDDVQLDEARVGPLVGLLLEMLRALGPPEMVRKAAGSASTSPPCEEEQAATMPTRLPVHNVYKGYRRDIVSVIANMSFHRPRVQDRVREDGGLLLVLQQCVVDEDNPYLREWGLWAIRNLTEGNERNVQELANLEIKKAVNVLDGLKVEVDELTKRPKLVNDSTSGDNRP